MKKPTTNKPATKSLHPRNEHNNGYDFKALIATSPVLGDYVSTNKYGNETIDFAKPAAVKALNTALLAHHYNIQSWDIPTGYLCPPVPGRVDYIHYVADLLKGQNETIQLLDIGTGANGIYALLAAQVYGWHCTATDIDAKALDNINTVLSHNPTLAPRVNVRRQMNKKHIFSGIIQPDEQFDISVCNPPFYGSHREALRSNQRKRDNLAANRNQQRQKRSRQDAKALNFGGHQLELWYEGGEMAFLQIMMEESQLFAKQCRWFTSLVSKTEYLEPLHKMLKKLGAKKVKEIEMTQGNKITRVLAWSFV